MHHRTAFLLAACVSLAVLAWLAVDDEGPVLESSFSLDAGVEVHAAGRKENVIRRRVDAKAIPAASNGTTFEIRVVERHSRRPIEGATVWFFTKGPDELFASWEDRAAFMRSSGSKQERLVRFGACRTSDRDGCVTVPLTEWGARCIAQKDGMHGELSRPSARAGARYVVELDRDITALVRVVDQGRRPVTGVGVQLRRSAAAMGSADPDAQFAVTCGRSRAPDGIVVLRHLQNAQRLWPTDDDGKRRTRIQLEVLGLDDPGIPLDCALVSPDPIEIVKPSTGRVVIRIRDQLGHRTRDAYLVGLEITDAGSYQCSTLFRRMEDASASFEHVAVGKTLRAFVQHDASRFEHTFAGPTRDGESVAAELRIAVRDFVLSGRARHADGRPITGERITALVTDRERTISANAGGTTDAEGRFRLALTTDVSGLDLGAVRFRIVLNDGSLIARGPVLGLLRTGETTVGELRFRNAPLLVAGRIVDDEGRPIGGARGFVESDPALQFRAAPDGRFRIESAAPNIALRLHVEAPGCARRDPVAFFAGQDDLLVPLAPGGEVRLTVRVDEETTPEALAFLFIPASSAAHEAERTAMELAASLGRGTDRIPGGWVVRWRGIAPGTYRIETRAAVDPLALAVLEPIVVRARELTKHELDLRRSLRTLTVRVRNRSGEPVDTAGGRVFVRRTAGAEIPIALRKGVARITTARRAVDLRVAVPGHLPRQLSGVHADLDVHVVKTR